MLCFNIYLYYIIEIQSKHFDKQRQAEIGKKSSKC